MKTKIGIFVIMITCCLAAMVVAQAPQILNFQGQLNDSTNNPVVDGEYSIEFRIYTDETGGTPVWSQTVAEQEEPASQEPEQEEPRVELPTAPPTDDGPDADADADEDQSDGRPS